MRHLPARAEACSQSCLMKMMWERESVRCGSGEGRQLWGKRGLALGLSFPALRTGLMAR